MTSFFQCGNGGGQSAVARGAREARWRERARLRWMYEWAPSRAAVPDQYSMEMGYYDLRHSLISPNIEPSCQRDGTSSNASNASKGCVPVLAPDELALPGIAAIAGDGASSIEYHQPDTAHASFFSSPPGTPPAVPPSLLST